MNSESDCIPLEEEDPELGELISRFCNERPFKGQGHLYAKEGAHSLLVFCQLGLISLRKFLAWYIHDKSLSRSDRNAACPCGSGSKYKKCCSRYE